MEWNARTNLNGFPERVCVPVEGSKRYESSKVESAGCVVLL